MFGIIKRADWFLNAAIILLAIAGFLTLFSISSDLFIRQIIFFSIGAIFLIFAPIFDFRHLVSYRWFILSILILSVVLLSLVHFIGIEVSGSRSWLDLHFFRLQPSEFAKAALIIVLSAFFSKRHIEIKRPEIIFKSFMYFAVPVTLILLEPDLGSALILFGIWFGFLLVAGLSAKHIAISVVALIILSSLAWSFGLRDYQRNRILTVFNPEMDPLGISYNVIQSRNAIGSAGFFGKGFGQGEIVQLGFLPAAHTDFIFASFVEEWGIISGIILIMIFSFMIWRVSLAGLLSEDNFSKFICLGTAIFLGLQFMVNIGSTLGLTPVIGVVLPFLSAGGSNLIVSMFMLGIVQNIASRKGI